MEPAEVKCLSEALSALRVDDSPRGDTPARDPDRIDITLTGIELLCDTYDFMRAIGESDDFLYDLWPAVFDWLDSFQPMVRSFDGARLERLDESSRVVVLVTRAYRTLIRSDPAKVARHLYCQAEIVRHLLSLWIDCPLYMPALTKGTDEVTATHSLTLTVIDVYNAFVKTGSPEIVDEGFYCQLRSVAPDTRQMYDRFVRQTQHLVRLVIIPTSQEVLYTHFTLLSMIVQKPQFPRARACSRSVIRGFVDAAEHCLTHKEGERGACAATDLLDALCFHDLNNRTLRRLVDCGAFDLLRHIGDKGITAHMDKLVVRLNATFSQPSFLRVFHKRYRRTYPPVPCQPGIVYGYQDWNAVIHAYHVQYQFYRRMRRSSQWKSALQCSRAEGPHRPLLRGICPCGEAVYCSVACQRRHWVEAHRRTCCAAEGPWRLKGAVTLNDITQMCMDVFTYIDVNWESLSARVFKLMREKVRARQRGTQIEIIADLTIVFGGDVYEVNARETDSDKLMTPTILTGVQILLGGAKVRRMLPLTYDIRFFQSSS
ncbi:hypothetical protein EV714DRAFT_277035 [Schizophyllum commune]